MADSKLLEVKSFAVSALQAIFEILNIGLPLEGRSANLTV
jgi:hypothetical protein